jgi:uncharacterized protein YutE (UPF0331/DUF86 family)
VVDRDLIIAKAASVRVHLDRIAAKAGADLQVFMSDRDRQDVVSFNLHLAIENCIDIAAHIISENGWGVPGSASEMFYLLEDRGILDPELTERMIKAVGLRNLIVHEYGKIDLSLLFATVRNNLNDLNSYLSNIFRKLDIIPNDLENLP